MLPILLIATIVIVAIAILVTILVPFDSENWKRCKCCSKRIKIEAAKCRYCKKVLLTYPDDSKG